MTENQNKSLVGLYKSRIKGEDNQERISLMVLDSKKRLDRAIVYQDKKGENSLRAYIEELEFLRYS